MLILTISPLVLDNPAMQQSIAGYICILLCLLQYSLPCVAAVQALKANDGSAINGPLGVAGALCGCFWTIYGFMQGVVAIWAPNIAACLLSVLLFSIKLYIGSARGIQPADGSAGLIGLVQTAAATN